MKHFLFAVSLVGTMASAAWFLEPDQRLGTLLACTSMLTVLLLIARWRTSANRAGASAETSMRRDASAPSSMPLLDPLLQPFEAVWAEERRRREALLIGPNAPLRHLEERHQAALRGIREQYDAAIAQADEEKRAADARAGAERDAEYAEADAECDRAYDEADRRKGMKPVSDGSAYLAHQASRGAAYVRREQRRGAAYARCESLRQAAYLAQQRSSAEAWRVREQANQGAYAEKEEAIRHHLRANQSLAAASSVAVVSGIDAYEPVSRASAQALSIPSLLDLAAQVVKGDKRLKTEEVAAIAAQLRDHLADGSMAMRSSEAVEEGRRLLLSLIRFLN